MERRWTDKGTKALGVAFVNDTDAEVLRFCGYFHDTEEDMTDEDGEVIEVWKHHSLADTERVKTLLYNAVILIADMHIDNDELFAEWTVELMEELGTTKEELAKFGIDFDEMF